MKVLFIHKGYADYLELAIRQVKTTNPGVEVILLGDTANACLGSLVHHENISDFNHRALDFERVYLHLSFNAVGFELHCFQRWLILYEFLAATACSESIFVFDSDVLVYVDLQELEKRFLIGSDFTVCHGWGPQFTYFRSIEVFGRFADYVFGTYSGNGAELSFYRESFEARKDAGHTTGGVSDMTAVRRFAEALGPRSTDLASLEAGPYFDENSSQDYGFRMGQRGKFVVWKDHKPWYTKADDGQLVRVGGIHFQGGEKVLMGEYYTGRFFVSLPLLVFRAVKFVREVVHLVRR